MINLNKTSIIIDGKIKDYIYIFLFYSLLVIVIFGGVVMFSETNNNNMLNPEDLKENETVDFNEMFKNSEISYIEIVDYESNLTYKVKFDNK